MFFVSKLDSFFSRNFLNFRNLKKRKILKKKRKILFGILGISGISTIITIGISGISILCQENSYNSLWKFRKYLSEIPEFPLKKAEIPEWKMVLLEVTWADDWPNLDRSERDGRTSTDTTRTNIFYLINQRFVASITQYGVVYISLMDQPGFLRNNA